MINLLEYFLIATCISFIILVMIQKSNVSNGGLQGGDNNVSRVGFLTKLTGSIASIFFILVFFINLSQKNEYLNKQAYHSYNKENKDEK